MSHEWIEEIVEENWSSETFEDFEEGCLESLSEAMDHGLLSVVNHTAQNMMQRTIESYEKYFRTIEAANAVQMDQAA